MDEFTVFVTLISLFFGKERDSSLISFVQNDRQAFTAFMSPEKLSSHPATA